MSRYLISLDDGSTSIAAEDLPAVSEAAHAVLRARGPRDRGRPKGRAG